MLGAFLCPLLRAELAVQHVGARNFVVAAAHQAQFDLVLDIFDVESATARARTHQRARHALRQLVHHLAHAGRRRALRAVHGQKGLHHGDGDLGGLERHHRAVAAHDLVLPQRAGRRRRHGVFQGGRNRACGRGGRRGAAGSLHGVLGLLGEGRQVGRRRPSERGDSLRGVALGTTSSVWREFKPLPVVDGRFVAIFQPVRE